MNARRAVLLLSIVLILLPLSSKLAQSLPNEVITPVSGNFVFTNESGLALFNTFSGETSQLISSDPGVFRQPRWSPDGNHIAFNRELSKISILHLASDELYEFATDREWSFDPVGWLNGENQILYSYYTFAIANDGFGSLEIFDQTTGEFSPVIAFNQSDSISEFPLPPNIRELKFTRFYQSRLNPIFSDWILLQIEGRNPDDVYYDVIAGIETEATVFLTILWNYRTRELLSLDEFLGSAVAGIEDFDWSPDGHRFYATTYGNVRRSPIIHTIYFDPVAASLEEIMSTEMDVRSVIQWLGAGSLMIVSGGEIETPTDSIYLAEIQDDDWYEMEFIRNPIGAFHMANRDWLFMASEAERRQLSCLFDQTLSSQLAVGLTGRVAFTDGTPSRLRSAPDLYSEQVTLMAEGTQFTVLDGPTCMDGYRWWQLRLGDGTLGWAAEADTTTYFLEPQP